MGIVGGISLHSHVGTSPGRVEKGSKKVKHVAKRSKNRTTSEDWHQGRCNRRKWTG